MVSLVNIKLLDRKYFHFGYPYKLLGQPVITIFYSVKVVNRLTRINWVI